MRRVSAAGLVIGLWAGWAWGQGAAAETPAAGPAPVPLAAAPAPGPATPETEKELTREQIEEAIERGVKFLIDRQEADGHWGFKPGETAEQERYKVGQTALCVLAIQHSGVRSTEATAAVKKGISYIMQQPPEKQTYTAGLVEQVLYLDNPQGNQKAIAAYAWMLCGGQKRDGVQQGSWTYGIPELTEKWVEKGLDGLVVSAERGDNSNSQFGILGLVYAQKAGFQVPRLIWERARNYYAGAQHTDGGWEYTSEKFRGAGEPASAGAPSEERMSMALAGTVSLYMCDEMLADKSHKQCVAPATDPAVEAGLKWIGDHWQPKIPGGAPYTWYGCERLGLLMGYSEFGGHDWFQEGAKDVMPVVCSLADWPNWFGASANTSLAVLFLSRGRNPIIINKLKREGDWNLHRYDINNLIEYISGPGQKPSQWRIVTLDAKVDFLLKAPILWISGHKALKFTDEEKAKLKEYVDKGGTILGEDCCSMKPFDISFRALLKELWPDYNLTALPKEHTIYATMRKGTMRPELMGMALDKGQGRLGVIYIPHGISCKWEVGGSEAKNVMDVGLSIYLYVDRVAKIAKVAAAAETPAAPAAK